MRKNESTEQPDWLQQRDEELDDKEIPVDEYPKRDEYDRLAREFRG